MLLYGFAASYESCIFSINIEKVVFTFVRGILNDLSHLSHSFGHSWGDVFELKGPFLLAYTQIHIIHISWLYILYFVVENCLFD